MRNDIVTVASAADRIKESKRLINDAQALLQSHKARGTSVAVAFFTQLEAIALYENAADLTDISCKEQLAKMCYDLTWVVNYYAFPQRRGKKVHIGAESLMFATCLKGVNLHAELVGDLDSEESLERAWAQVLRVDNLACTAMRAGLLLDSERLFLESANRLIAFNEVNNQGHLDSRVWLPLHYNLARVRQALGRDLTEVLNTVEAGLRGFDLTSDSDYCREAFAKLCQLKSDLLAALKKAIDVTDAEV